MSDKICHILFIKTENCLLLEFRYQTVFYCVSFAVPSESNNTNLQTFQSVFIFPKKILSHSVLTDFIKVSLMSYSSWMNVMVERTSMESSVASLNPFWLPYEMSTNFKTLVCNHWSSMSESLNLAFISAILLKTRPARFLSLPGWDICTSLQLQLFSFKSSRAEAQRSN